MFYIVLGCYRPNIEFFRHQINSLRTQTYPRFQCLIADDSEDDSDRSRHEFFQELIHEDKRFFIRKNLSRLGVFHNFEHGLYFTPPDAEWICFCDQDDVWHPEKLERQRKIFDDPKVVLSHTDLSIMDRGGKILHPSCFQYENRDPNARTVPHLLMRNSITGSTIAFRTSLLPMLLPFPRQGITPRFHHDHWTALIAALAGEIHFMAAPPSVHYRQHSANVLGVTEIPIADGLGFRARLSQHPVFKLLNEIYLRPSPQLAALENEWLIRRAWLGHLHERQKKFGILPNSGELAVALRWTRGGILRAEFSLLQFVLRHLRVQDSLAVVAPGVFVGKIYHDYLKLKSIFSQPKTWLRPLLQRTKLYPLVSQARDQLVRVVNRPAVSRRFPRLVQWGDRFWCRYTLQKDLRESLTQQKVCVFAHFDPSGKVDDYVVYHLKCLTEAGFLIIFVTVCENIQREDAQKLDALCVAIIRRQNVGLDFGSWRTALLAYPQIFRAKLTVFTNDSVYGPLVSIPEFIHKMENKLCDFWGITESLEIQNHYQSYFLGFHQKCLRSAGFSEFFHQMGLHLKREEIVENYEVGLKHELTDRGLRGASLVPIFKDQTPFENPTFHCWREIIHHGAPYLKVKLLRENPLNQPIDDWSSIVTSRGFDPALIERHLRRFQ